MEMKRPELDKKNCRKHRKSMLQKIVHKGMGKVRKLDLRCCMRIVNTWYGMDGNLHQNWRKSHSVSGKSFR